MDVFVRNVDETTVRILDDLARKKKMSRNEYLKLQFDKIAVNSATTNERNQLDETLGRVADALEITFARLEKLEDGHQQLLYLTTLINDFEPQEIKRFLQGGA